MQSTATDTVVYKQLFNQLNDACVLFEIQDENAVIINTNTSFKQVFCDSLDAAIAGESLNELIVPDGKMNEAIELDKRTKQGKLNETVVKRTTNRGVRDFLYRGLPIDGNYGFGIYIDITDRLQKEQCIEVLQRVLRHNLRNELNVILSVIQTLTEENTSARMQDQAELVVSAAERLRMLTEEVKIIREIINDRQQSDVKALSLRSELMSAVEAVQEKEIGDTGTIDVDCDSNVTIHATPRITHAFKALIDNGIRHNDSQEPTVVVDAVKVNEMHAQITITDNGSGIPMSDKKVITGRSSLSPLEHGSGLGLWMTRWIIESSYGNISVDTESVTGTCFTITLPTHSLEHAE
jgi:signal transduction histidine kinase